MKIPFDPTLAFFVRDSATQAVTTNMISRSDQQPTDYAKFITKGDGFPHVYMIGSECNFCDNRGLVMGPEYPYGNDLFIDDAIQPPV